MIAYFLGRGRASLNVLRFSVRATVEGNDSFDRVKVKWSCKICMFVDENNFSCAYSYC